MKKFFALLPLMGGIGFLYGAYSFFIGAKTLSNQRWIMYASGILFLFFAFVFLAAFLKALFKSSSQSISAKEGASIKTAGNKVAAEIMDLRQETNIRVNMRAPYVLIAKGINPVSGQEQIFQSGWIWTDPFVQSQNHKIVDVYIDPSNPDRYFMDLESIGLSNKAASGSNLPNTALIAAFIIFVGAIGLSFYLVSKYKFQTPPTPSTQTGGYSSDTAECMKELYGQDILKKIEQKTFIPPADIGQRLQECIERKQ